MAAYDDRLRNILSLAQEDSRENRNLLFRHLADFYFQDRLPESARDRRLLEEIMGLVRDRVDAAVKEDIALTLAAMAHPSLELAALLAKDRIEVARPILIAIPFSDQFLLDIIAATGPEHHAVLRERNGVSTEVGRALALAEHRDQEAERRLRASRRAAAITEAAKTVAAEVKEAVPPATEPAAVPSEFPAAASEIEVTPPPKQEPKAPTVRVRPPPPASKRRPPQLSPSKPGGLGPLLRRERPVPEGAWVFITDRNGRLEALSDEAEKAFGRTAASLRGTDFFALLAPDSPVEFAEAVRRHRPLRDVEVTVENGEVSRWTLAASALFTLKDGQFEGYRGLARPTATPLRHAAPVDETPPRKLLHSLAEDAGRHADRIAEGGRDIVKAAKAKKTKRVIKQARRMIGEAEALRDVIETTVAALEARAMPESAESFDALPAIANALEDWQQESDDRRIKVRFSKKSEAAPIHFRRGLLARMTRAVLDLADGLPGDGKMKVKVGSGAKGVARIVFPLPGDGLEFDDDDELPVRTLRILRLLAEDAGGDILTRSDGKRITHLVFKLPLAEGRQEEPARRAG